MSKNQRNRNTSGLRSTNTMSREEHHEMSARGGRATADKLRAERALREIVRIIMELRPQLSPEEEKLCAAMGFTPDDELTNLVLGVLKQVENMRNGAVGAYQMLMEQGGYTEPSGSAAPAFIIINDIPRR